MYCPHCGLGQPAEHRFCVSCGSPLPGGLVPRRGHKVARWFWGMPVSPDDPMESALRVTRYLQEFDIATPEGSVRVPSHHVRFSIWVDDRAVGAISLPDDEAEMLAEFLLATVVNGSDGRERALR